MSDPIPGLTNVSFTCAYWDFLRGHRPVPKPEQHGLTPAAATVMKVMIETEWAEVRRKNVEAHDAAKAASTLNSQPSQQS